MALLGEHRVGEERARRPRCSAPLRPRRPASTMIEGPCKVGCSHGKANDAMLWAGTRGTLASASAPADLTTFPSGGARRAIRLDTGGARWTPHDAAGKLA